MSTIYLGTRPPVGAAGTQRLLHEHAAIWCTHPLRAVWPANHPQLGGRLWLLWRDDDRPDMILLLGGGRIWAPPQGMYDTAILWTDPQHPGMRDVAEAEGYEGGTGMSFLRLVLAPYDLVHREVQGLGALNTRFNQATAVQEQILQNLLPIA